MSEKFLAAVRALLEQRDEERDKSTGVNVRPKQHSRSTIESDAGGLFSRPPQDPCRVYQIEGPSAPLGARTELQADKSTRASTPACPAQEKNFPVKPSRFLREYRSEAGDGSAAAVDSTRAAPGSRNEPARVTSVEIVSDESDESDDEVIDLVDGIIDDSVPAAPRPVPQPVVADDHASIAPVFLPSASLTSAADGGKENDETDSAQAHHQRPKTKDDCGRALKRHRVKPSKHKESRGATFRTHPSKAVLDRLGRLGNRGRLFLVDKKETGEGLEFAIMGSNGNIYRSVVSTGPSCNCPDFTKRRDANTRGPCKHLIFVFRRVLKVPEKDPTWWQVRLLPSELKSLRDAAPRDFADCDVMAEESVLKQYQENSRGSERGGRRPIQGECTICYDELISERWKNQVEEVVSHCRACSHSFHAECLRNWGRARSNAVCPLCTTPMKDGPGKASADGEYLNLAAYSTSHATQLSLAEMYANTHQFIGRSAMRSRGRGGPARASFR